jgi:hypothetical protein
MNHRIRTWLGRSTKPTAAGDTTLACHPAEYAPGPHPPPPSHQPEGPARTAGRSAQGPVIREANDGTAVAAGLAIGASPMLTCHFTGKPGVGAAGLELACPLGPRTSIAPRTTPGGREQPERI